MGDDEVHHACRDAEGKEVDGRLQGRETEVCLNCVSGEIPTALDFAF